MLHQPLMSGGEVTDHRKMLGNMCNVFIVKGRYKTTLKSKHFPHIFNKNRCGPPVVVVTDNCPKLRATQLFGCHSRRHAAAASRDC